MCIPDFAEGPSSLNVTVGKEAVFQCQYTSIHIDWRLNGSTLEEFSPLGILVSWSPLPGGEIQHKLTITAALEHDNTIIECVSKSHDGSQTKSTVPVVLRVQG